MIEKYNERGNKMYNGDYIYYNQTGMYVNGIKQTDPKVIEEYNKIVFWGKVAIKAQDNLCWEWLAGTNTKGYGQTTFNGVATAASRKAYMLHHNVVLQDRKMLVCHTCDNPVCCNPKHLFLGTSADNLRDMSIKGRAIGYWKGKKRKYEDTLRGSKNPVAKLKEEDVIEMRRLVNENGVMQKEVCKLFEVSKTTVCQIVNYKIWRQVK